MILFLCFITFCCLEEDLAPLCITVYTDFAASTLAGGALSLRLFLICSIHGQQSFTATPLGFASASSSPYLSFPPLFSHQMNYRLLGFLVGICRVNRPMYRVQNMGHYERRQGARGYSQGIRCLCQHGSRRRHWIVRASLRIARSELVFPCFLSWLCMFYVSHDLFCFSVGEFEVNCWKK